PIGGSHTREAVRASRSLRTLSSEMTPRLLIGQLLAYAAITFSQAARADIFQWEYVTPGDPSSGMQQSSTLCPDGSGVNATAHADLFGRDLTKAYLFSKTLSDADAAYVTLASGDLANANLTGVDFSSASFDSATLTNANLGQANLTNANLAFATLTGAV